jgi:uncharacterized protein YunC (DUF1805 family)
MGLRLLDIVQKYLGKVFSFFRFGLRIRVKIGMITVSKKYIFCCYLNSSELIAISECKLTIPRIEVSD